MPQHFALQAVDVERPVLDLSGEGLRAILGAMVTGSEQHGGIAKSAHSSNTERYGLFSTISQADSQIPCHRLASRIAADGIGNSRLVVLDH